MDVHEHQKSEEDNIRREWVRSGPAKETVKSVCENCNLGWMSFLEKKSKPVLSALIRGARRTLKGGELILVATWATKTAPVIESRNPPVQYVSTPEMRKIVMNEQRPPASIQVDAFTFGGEHLSGYWRHSAEIVTGSASDLSNKANYAVTVMAFGYLGLRVIDDHAALHAPLSGVSAPKLPGVAIIYPSLSTLDWPISPVLKSNELKALRLASMSSNISFVGSVGFDDEGSC